MRHSNGLQPRKMPGEAVSQVVVLEFGGVAGKLLISPLQPGDQKFQTDLQVSPTAF